MYFDLSLHRRNTKRSKAGASSNGGAKRTNGQPAKAKVKQDGVRVRDNQICV